MAFIGLDRGIVDHWIYQDAEYFKAWFEILYRARFSHEPEKKLIEGKLVKIEYGQFIFGRVSWSESLGISERRLRTLFERLIRDDMIKLIAKYPKFTVYNVVNYEKFNSPESRQNLARSSPKSDQQSDQQNVQQYQGFGDRSDQQNVQQTTNKRPANDQQTTTQEEGSKKVNKDNKVKKTLYAPNVALTADEYQKLCDEYGEPATKASIDYLHSYKIEKNYKTKSDYLTIKRWVVDAVKKGGNKHEQPRTSSRRSADEFDYNQLSL